MRINKTLSSLAVGLLLEIFLLRFAFAGEDFNTSTNKITFTAVDQHKNASFDANYFQQTSTQETVPSLSSDRELKGRIIGGTPAKEGEFPSFGYSDCGGTLIHRDIFMSAAHCKGLFKPKRTLLSNKQGGVTIGGIKGDYSDGTYFKAKFEVIHPLYAKYVNDIMIVKLVIKNDSPSIPLQKLNFVSTIPNVGQKVVAIGVGNTVEGDDNSYSDELLKVSLDIIDENVCAEVLFEDGFSGTEMICAGKLEGGKDTCQGDSGGPLLSSDGVTQLGITSFGYGCGERGTPAAYTRVSHYEEFIKDMICGYSDFLDDVDCTGRKRLRRPCPCGRFGFVCRYLNNC